MAENEEGEVTQGTGNEWEVVQLTASAYNAAPSPDSTQHTTQDELTGKNQGAMFMSGHFVFPPSQHENLPVEPENGSEDDDVSELVDEERENLNDNEDENLNAETTDYSETALSNSSVVDESEGIDDSKGDDHDDGELPCEAWWKRRAISIYVHAKEANTIWSIIIAATVMGLVVIGHRWQDLHLKVRLGINDEKIARMMVPVSRLKDMLIGGHRQGSLIHGSFSTER